ncbi:hypothetical protein EG329_001813 [Mollisiaceae sp. DMI_Dod_QoI]|nr:hypothetical protein EG329_001813 [Helotiales sp. DMI_Dod_QoI]
MAPPTFQLKPSSLITSIPLQPQTCPHNHAVHDQKLVFTSTSTPTPTPPPQKLKPDPNNNNSPPLPPKLLQSSPPHPTKTTTALIKTRIPLLSDPHGVPSLPNPLPSNLPIDLTIHTGDLSPHGSLPSYHSTRNLLTSLPSPLTLIIPGNHDLTLDPLFYTLNSSSLGKDLHSQALSLWTCSETKSKGIILLEEGTHEFVLGNGARVRVYASPWTVRGNGVREWAFGYESAEDRFNGEGRGVVYGRCVGTEGSVVGEGVDVDVVMTHGPPRYRLDRGFGDGDGDWDGGGQSLGCPHLFRAVRRGRPALHVFGHVHGGYGAELVTWEKGGGREELPDDDDVDDGIGDIRKIEGRVEDGVRRIELQNGVGDRERGVQTLFVNAALMGREGELDNLPWLVELELEKA